MNRSPYEIKISNVPIQQIASISELKEKYIRERRQDFLDSYLASKLASIAAKELVLLPSTLSRIHTDGISAEYMNVPELSYTRHESRAAVKFGQLVISYTGRESASELIAVKYTSPKLAAREFAATQVFRSRMGEQYAFDPIGFICNESRSKTGYLSRYRHEVTTLDRLLWNDKATQEQRLNAVARAGSWLAFLHNNKLVHGDSQAKNIAHDSADNPVYPDLETASEIGEGEGDIRLIQKDIRDFYVYQDMSLSPYEADAFKTAYLDEQNSNKIQAMYFDELKLMPLQTVAHFQPT